MNDRFKFRIWDKKIKKIRSVWGLTPFGPVACDSVKMGGTHRVPLGDCIIMQCTGLKDKDGKLIYEGDIVTDVLANKFIVNFSIEYSSFLLTNIKTKESMVFYPKVKLEVIGNQFENPELLEEQCANGY